jgi:hypothetical protein
MKATPQHKVLHQACLALPLHKHHQALVHFPSTRTNLQTACMVVTTRQSGGQVGLRVLRLRHRLFLLSSQPAVLVHVVVVCMCAVWTLSSVWGAASQPVFVDAAHSQENHLLLVAGCWVDSFPVACTLHARNPVQSSVQRRSAKRVWAGLEQASVLVPWLAACVCGIRQCGCVTEMCGCWMARLLDGGQLCVSLG